MTGNRALVTRNGLIWLLVAQILSIIPLLFYLPWWILGLWLGCALWRIQIYRMKFSYPPTFVKIILIVIIGVGVYFSKGTILGLEGGLVLLVAAFSLKLIELKTKRDALVILYIGFLVVTTLYLYDNTFIWVSYSLLPIVALLAALIGLNQVRLAIQPWANVRLACVLLLQALPLMLILFFFFPRLEPFWSFPAPNKQQKTGITNKMTPGEMGNMARSSDLVARVAFKDNNIPTRQQLYWRALALELYDGRTWTQAWDVTHQRRSSPRWQYVPNDGSKVEYTVIMQPNSQHWLLALETPLDLPSDTFRAVDFHLEHNNPISSVYSYQLTSWLNAKRELKFTPRANLNKSLPNTDPKARALGEQLNKQYQGDAGQIVAALLKYFKEEPYYYTLDTPDLGANSVDKFFFETKSGFCEHYAGATTFILRAAGVPARVVLGYQGGEVNTAGNFVQIRQFDAHAWVEYWESNKGWVRIDPTFQVAPDRINIDLNAALNPQDQSLVGNNSLMGYGSSSFLSTLRMTWENFNNEWDIFISSYSADRQRDIIKDLFGKANWVYVGILLVVSLFIVTVSWLLLLFKPWRRELDPVLRVYKQFETLLAKQGVVRESSEGPQKFAVRAASELPDYKEQINTFSQAFIAQQYAGKSSLKELKASLHELKKVLPYRFKIK